MERKEFELALIKEKRALIDSHIQDFISEVETGIICEKITLGDPDVIKVKIETLESVKTKLKESKQQENPFPMLREAIKELASLRLSDFYNKLFIELHDFIDAADPTPRDYVKIFFAE